MVDDLLLVNRRAQLGERLLIVAVEVPHFLFPPGKGARAGEQRLSHLFLGYFHARFRADLGQQQAQTDATLGDATIFGASGFLGRAVLDEAAAGGFLLAFDLPPDLVEFLIDEPFGNVELVARRQFVEQLTLDLLARGAGVVDRDALADVRAQRVERLEAEALGEFVVYRRAIPAPRRP